MHNLIPKYAELPMSEDRPCTFLKYAVACSIIFSIISCLNPMNHYT